MKHFLPEKQTKLPQKWSQIHRKTSSGRCRRTHSQLLRGWEYFSIVFQGIKVYLPEQSEECWKNKNFTDVQQQNGKFWRRRSNEIVPNGIRDTFSAITTWNRVLFSDEMWVMLRSDGRGYVCRPNATRFAEKYWRKLKRFEETEFRVYYQKPPELVKNCIIVFQGVWIMFWSLKALLFVVQCKRLLILICYFRLFEY